RMLSLIAEHTPGSITIDAPAKESREDATTTQKALEYLAARKPRVLMVALNDTDEAAHDRRYDSMLQAISTFDSFLARLWMALQSMEQYRGRTTLIITTDHGRGMTEADWNMHGRAVPGSEKVWLAIAGPDTRPSLDVAQPEQRDIAPTILRLAGIG